MSNLVEKNTILDVKNLRVSFRTPAGKVQAVRDISFDLYKGETLAIVGESGSGKSVSLRSIMGINTDNAIIESGEIVFEGQDLLKIREEDFIQIRGEKISMVFQDPLSALNPIVRIGKQVMEGMLIKGRLRQRLSRQNLKRRVKFLNMYLNLALATREGEGGKLVLDKERAAKNNQNVSIFRKFVNKAIALENAYNKSFRALEEAVFEIERFAFRLEKNVFADIREQVLKVAEPSLETFNFYLVNKHEPRVRELIGRLKELTGLTPGGKFKFFMENVGRGFLGIFTTLKERVYADVPKDEMLEILAELKGIFKKALKRTLPNFFCMGYYVVYSGNELPMIPTEELNPYLRDYLDQNFMLAFIDDLKKAIVFSHNRTIEAKKKFLEQKETYVNVFNKELIEGTLDRKAAFTAARELSVLVADCLDELANRKDSLTLTFNSSINHYLKRYFKAIRQNVKEQRKADKEQAKYDRQTAAGKQPTWSVKPAALTDLDLIKGNITNVIERLADSYSGDIEYSEKRDFDLATVYTIDYLKAQASGVVNKVTRRIAKRRAIKLMDEVGITHPEKRFRQYPFQFSGGMCQRIVIAIALSSIEDGILICDEPTTALDVTIQAQILELINGLKEKRGLSVIFVTHDLGVVANIADRVAVMYAGKIVEQGTADDVFYNPQHPYTWALLASMPDLETTEALDAIPGTPPNMIFPPKGDAFAARNKYAMEICFEEQPPMFKVSDTHYAATWLLHENAPKVEKPKIVTERIARSRAKYG